MKQKIVISFLITLAALNGFGQSLEQLLGQVQQNNLAIKAKQAGVEVQKLEHRLGNNPPNPQFDGAYLWGSPAEIGSRKDFSVSQEIEFPSVYHHRKKLAGLLDRQAELGAEQFVLELKLEASALWAELVGLNRQIGQQQKRAEQAQQLASAYEQRLNTGEGNRLDRNKAALYAFQEQQHLEQLKQEKEMLQNSLNLLNGAKPFAVDNLDFETVALPVDKESWIASQLESNPLSQQYAANSEVAARELRLYQSQALPSLRAGYMLEKTSAEKYSGVSLGLSIPLWENRHAVKAARMNEQQMALQQQVFQLQFKAELEQLYRAVELASARVDAFKTELEKLEQAALLKEALDAGQLSLIDYLQELQFNYTAMDQLLQAEKELQVAWVKLKLRGE